VEEDQSAGIRAVGERTKARATPTDDRAVAATEKSRVRRRRPGIVSCRGLQQRRWLGDELIREVLAK
jgi:hypothetical protein